MTAGAHAERNTFQGERCIYNALNDRIRNLLLQYDFSKSSDPYQYWSTHISNLLNSSPPSTSDFLILTSSSLTFHVHKFLLASRAPYFDRLFRSQPTSSSWTFSSSIPIEAIQLAVRHIYLGQMSADLPPLGSSTAEEDIVTGLGAISNLLDIETLRESIHVGGDRKLARQRFRDEQERALGQISEFFKANVLGRKIVVDKESVTNVRWSCHNPAFADVLLRADDASRETDPRVGTASLYPAHRAILIRSDYFGRMFSGSFVESQKANHLHIVNVDCSSAVLELVLCFLYTETTDCPLDLALDLLYAADMLFLDGLKNKAAVAISTLGSGARNALGGLTPGNGARGPDADPELINIYDVIHAAWDLGVHRLEAFAARYLAARLEDYIDDGDFHQLIRDSANRIRLRQETDTIELLDDIRYYLSERFRLRFEDTGLQEMLTAGPSEDSSTSPTGPTTTTTAEDSTTTGDDAGPTTAECQPVDDDFASDAVDYHSLLAKIDDMLQRLGLDA